MKPSSSLLYVSPLTIIYVVLGFMLNQFQTLFWGYLFCFIHELSHVFFAKLFQLDVPKIVFLPVGFYAEIKNLENIPFMKQIIVILAGPLSYFISLIIILICKRINIISIYGYQNIYQLNLFIMCFNLLPFYPLDGGRILDILLANCLPEHKLRIARIVINLVTFTALSFYLVSLGQLLLLVLLFISAIQQIIMYKKEYLYFLINRINCKIKRKDHITDKLEIIRNKNNLFFYKKDIYNEQYILQCLIAKNSPKKVIK